MKKLFSSLLLPLLSLPVFGQEMIPPGTPWSEPYFARIDATFDNGAFHARWDISRCACGDIHVLAEETLPGEIRTGEQLLLNRDALLVRGYEGHQGELSALLDSPILMMQLLFLLLQRVDPSGPPSVSGNLEVRITEPAIHLELDTGIAFGIFPAPWSVTGIINPVPAGRIAYDLRFGFEFHEPGQQPVRSQIALAGFLDYAEQDFPIQDSDILDGWSLGWLSGPGDERPGLQPGISLAEFRETL